MLMRRILTLVLSVVALYASAAAQQTFKATVTAEGTLATVLGDKANEIESLAVVGPINDADFNTMWSASFYGKLTALDLSEAVPANSEIPERAFFHPDAQHTVFPEGYEGYIPLKLSSIKLPTQLKSIGNQAFRYTEIAGIELPESLQTIGFGAFAYCQSLKEINIPANVTEIPRICFTLCSQLTKVTGLEGVKKIDKLAFSVSGLSEIELPAGLLEINQHAFNYTNLRTITIPSSCKVIGYEAFSICLDLKSAVIESAEDIPFGFMGGCFELESCILCDDIKNIGIGAFDQCYKLSNISLPTSLETIQVFAFRSTALSTLTIPASVTKIESEAFGDVPLQSIYSLATMPKDVGSALDAFDCDKSIPVYIPQGSLEAYKSTTGWWSYFTNLIEVDMAGVDDAVAAPAASVSVQGGAIVIAGNGEDYAVFSADGRSIAAGRASGSVSVDAVPGLYIVRTGAKTVKVRL